MTLHPRHYTMLHTDSAIADAVITQRGYLSLDDPAAVQARGFASVQAKTAPVLALPLWNVHGEQTGWQIRPENPRLKKGQVLKYETPVAGGVQLDVHPTVQRFLVDPAVPLWITEGVKKGDALVSAGADCAIALIGVWGFKRNGHMLPDWQHVALKGRTVYVVYDSDTATKKEVAKAQQTLLAWLRYREALPACVEWPEEYQQKKWGVDDYLAAGHTLADLLKLVPFIEFGSTKATAAKATAIRSGPPYRSDKAGIELNPEVTRIVDEGQTALLALPKAPVIYQRARKLTVIARGVPPPKWLRRPPDMPVMVTASQAHLVELASQAAHWWQRADEDWKEVLPPRWFVPTLQGRTTWPFPPLEGIVSSPTLRPDGSLLTMPGYDKDTGLYLDTNGTTFPAIPSNPTYDDARSAIGALQEAVRDFPFAEKWHFSATLAAILSLVCRFAVKGNVPLFPIRATASGSGKGLLADVISIIGTGYPALRWPEVKDNEEERKRLLTIGLAGDLCVHIDNVVKPLGSPALDLALTSPTFTDRILGTNEPCTVSLNMVWLASGNNMQFQDDTARRAVPIDLDPKMEKPEERTGFTYDPLLPWLHKERPRLTVAALTIVKAFFVAGCPTQAISRFGSFEAWSDLIRQALVWAGEADPNQGRTNIEAESNPEYEQLARLLATWEVCYPIPEGKRHSEGNTLKEVVDAIAALKVMDKPRTVPDIPNTPNEWDALQDALGAYDFKYDGKTITNMRPLSDAFRKLQGRTIGTRRFRSVGVSHHAKQWAIEGV